MEVGAQSILDALAVSNGPHRDRRPLRILHCIPTMRGGGAERQLALLATAHRRKGHDVHVALMREGINFPLLATSGATIHRLVTRSNRDPRIALDIARVVRKVRPDVVQTWLPQMDVLGGAAALVTRTPWVLSERCAERAYEHGFENRVLRPWIARRASAIVANSNDGASYWAARSPGHPSRTVVRNALAVDEIAATGPARWEDLGLGSDVRVLLFAGRLAPQKSLDVLVEALGIVLRQSDATAILCGDGPSRDDIERQARALGITDRVRILGYRTDLWAIMKRAVLFVSPSLFEGQPNTVMEAMACGSPLVVSDIPAHREFLDESMALLVPPTSPTELAAAMLAVLNDPDAAGRRATSARYAATAFSVDAAAEAYERVYRAVLRSVA